MTARESGEVGVRRADGETVLDRERGQVGVANEVAAELVARDELGQQVGVSDAGFRYPGDIDSQPVLDVPGSFPPARAVRPRPRNGAAQRAPTLDM